MISIFAVNLWSSGNVALSLTDLLYVVHRLNEAVMHFGESIKEIINEEFGDGM